jgi:hypothetical protein
LVGDFNALTAKLSDYIIPDENLLHDILDITDDANLPNFRAAKYSTREK